MNDQETMMNFVNTNPRERFDAMPLPGLYCLTDRTLSGLSHQEQVRRILAGGCRLIQLREKTLGMHEFDLEARLALKQCREAGSLLIVNDDPEICDLIGADGVHVGQGDMSPAEVRQIAGREVIVGLSTHNREQLLAALEEPVDYIAFGPVFATSTKENPDPETGLDEVRWAAHQLAEDGRPLVLIGGISQENAKAVLEAAPKALLAVIGAVVRGGDQVMENVAEFQKILQTEREYEPYVERNR